MKKTNSLKKANKKAKPIKHVNTEQKEILDAVVSQDAIRLVMVTDKVTELVTDAVLAKTVNDALVALLTPYNAKFAAAIEAEDSEVDLSAKLV